MLERIALPNGLVVDAGQKSEVLRRAVELVRERVAASPAGVITALHVGGLQHSSDQSFRRSLAASDLVCADGAAVVALSRLAGARFAERVPTTDFGLELISEMVRTTGSLRVALIGGKPGLASRAGDRLELLTGCNVVFTASGYQEDWESVLEAMDRQNGDVVVLGLGSPYETKWAHEHRAKMKGVILTCGGWFGFLVGDEVRAPRWAQRAGLEWTWRLAQSPARLARRYGVGLTVTLKLAASILAHRVLHR